MPGRSRSSVPLIDVTARAGDSDVRAILSVLVWTGELDQLERIVSTYLTGPRLLAFEEGGRILGLIGIELDSDRRGIIRHIAVDPSAQGSRGKGLGRGRFSPLRDPRPYR